MNRTDRDSELAYAKMKKEEMMLDEIENKIKQQEDTTDYLYEKDLMTIDEFNSSFKSQILTKDCFE